MLFLHPVGYIYSLQNSLIGIIDRSPRENSLVGIIDRPPPHENSILALSTPSLGQGFLWSLWSPGQLGRICCLRLGDASDFEEVGGQG